MNSLLELILADDTNVIICSKKLDDLCSVRHISVSESKWFAGNKLVLSPDKTNIVKFITNNLQPAWNVSYEENYIKNHKYNISWFTNS
jgi:hypothetical protein